MTKGELLEESPLVFKAALQNLAYLLLFLLATALVGCGGSDDSSSSSGGGVVNITGSAKNFTGSQTEMAKWAVVFLERDSGVSRVADIDAAGNYKIFGFDSTQAHTMVLLDPQYRLAAVLSLTGTKAATIHQFFILSGLVVPTFVHAGPTIGFADTSPLLVEADIAADADSDGIPDGMESSGLTSEPSSSLWGLSLQSATDSDGDGVLNSVDVDIDGDGIVNWVDGDDNGNTILDIFDTDANGDGVEDSQQTVSELYFSKGLVFNSVQVMQEVQSDNSLRTSLIFTARVRPEAIPQAVVVRGPAELLENSSVQTNNPETGQASLQAWDKALLDDGANEDGGALDGLYSRRVVLATGKAPKANQMVFVELQNTVGSDVVASSFPYTFPKLTTAAVSGAYATDTRIVTLSGTPFAGVTNYVWTVHIFDSAGLKTYTSPPVDGTSTTFTIPEGVLEAGKTYTAVIVASSLDRIPSFPSWIIKSQSFPLQ